MNAFLASLSAMLLSTPAAALQDWFPNPAFDWVGEEPRRNICFNAEVQQQLPLFRGRTLFFAVPLPSDNTTRFGHVRYTFCVEDAARPGFCGLPYTIILRTSDPNGWEMDWERSTPESFYVRAKDLGRYADILDRESAYVGSVDILKCRSFFGIQ